MINSLTLISFSWIGWISKVLVCFIICNRIVLVCGKGLGREARGVAHGIWEIARIVSFRSCTLLSIRNTHSVG